MAGKTVAEKILSAHAGCAARPGDLVVCDVDFLMLHDVFAHLAMDGFRKMGGTRVFDPDRVAIIFDHSSPAPNRKTANIHALTRTFAKEQGVRFHEAGEGVCHQLMVEKGYAKAGDLILGTDSHTCTYGAVGALATGIGATDAAVTLLTGQQWLRVPPTVRIEFTGALQPMCLAKDAILAAIGRLGVGGASYRAIEFHGDWLAGAPLADRMTVGNMAVEMGAKCGITIFDGMKIAPDPDAAYESTVRIDLDSLAPAVAFPHMVDEVKPVSEAKNIPVQQGVIGSCTNGRIEDFRIAADILRGKSVKGRLLVMPASNAVLGQMADEGVLAVLLAAGAVLCTPGCGVCCGTIGGVPADGERVIATTNRNFRGRMGNNQAEVYLASPATVAASMLTGVISDPRDLL